MEGQPRQLCRQDRVLRSQQGEEQELDCKDLRQVLEGQDSQALDSQVVLQEGFQAEEVLAFHPLALRLLDSSHRQVVVDFLLRVAFRDGKDDDLGKGRLLFLERPTQCAGNAYRLLQEMLNQWPAGLCVSISLAYGECTSGNDFRMIARTSAIGADGRLGMRPNMKDRKCHAKNAR